MCYEGTLNLEIMRFRVLILLGVANLFMAGRAFADVKWDLDGGVTTGYDSNITYVNNNPIGDMVTHASLNTGLTQQGKNDVCDLKAGILENIYSNHSTLDNLEENVRGNYVGDLSAYDHIKAGEVFTHSVGSSNLENVFGRINGNYSTYYNKSGLAYTHDFTDQLTSTLKYAQTNYIFSTQSLSDSAGYNPGVSAKYAFSSASQAMVNYDYSRRTFSPGGSSSANTPTIGWRQYLTTQWYVDLLAGVDFITGFGESIIKPRYGVGLTHDVDQNTQLTVQYAKQYETDPFTQDIDNDWHLALNAVHQFTNRIKGDIGLFTGQGKFVISGTSYQFIGTNVSLKYTLNDHIDFTVTYGLQDSISKSAIRNSLHNTVFAGITYKF
jgi:hypothetical protein